MSSDNDDKEQRVSVFFFRCCELGGQKQPLFQYANRSRQTPLLCIKGSNRLMSSYTRNLLIDSIITSVPPSPFPGFPRRTSETDRQTDVLTNDVSPLFFLNGLYQPIGFQFILMEIPNDITI